MVICDLSAGDMVSFASALLQAGLLFAAIWLAWETRKLRVVSSETIAYDRETERNRIAPQVRILASIDEDSTFASLRVRNVSNNLVVNSLAFIFDRERKAYLIGSGVKDFIEPESQVVNALDAEERDIKGAIEALVRRLSALDAVELEAVITGVVETEPTRSVLGYIFHDALRNPYVQFRFVQLADDQVKYRVSPYAGHPRRLKRAENAPWI